ncbi:MAG: PDZ domain-containing protein, partial [Pirellulales bacterium]|nr:PDZ domain-containing protein [Pirellulales bacterium]
MFNTRWHGRAEWATLVAVIFTAGYLAQARAEEPDGEKVAVEVAASEDVQVEDVQRAIDAVVQKVQLDQGDDGAVQIQIRLVGQDDKDLDVDDQPAAKVIKKLVTIVEDKETEDKVSDENEIELSITANPPNHFLGIQISQVDPILREHLKLDESQGILVIAVVDESPADKAGVKEHDILLTANGEPLDKLGDLIEVIRQSDGKEISLELIRVGEKMSCTVKPEKRSEHYGTDPADEVQGFDPDGMKDLR